MNGIDVSYAQSKINWNQVKTDFAIIRIGYGREIKQKDAQFEANYQGAKGAGIPLGGYHYSYAMDTAGAEKEAKACLAMIGDKKFELPIAYDLEEPKQFNTLSPAALYDIYKTFASIIEAAGHTCMLYTNKNWMVNKWDKTDIAKDGVIIWMAQYNRTMDYTGPAKISIWQNSSDGSMPGIKGEVDTNICLVDLNELYGAKWVEDKGRWWYRHKDGSYTKNGWEKIDGTWYHFDPDGWMQTGWLEDKGEWYYLKLNGAMAENEIITIQSQEYGTEEFAFRPDGRMIKTDNRGALIK